MKRTHTLLSVLLALVLLVSGLSLPARAEPAPTEEALTPPGNLTLVDDQVQKDGQKQFITLQSKKGNYFYLIIDRSGETENVYFLNLVDEADLMALIDRDDIQAPLCICETKCKPGKANPDCPLCRENVSQCQGKAQPPGDPPATEPTVPGEPPRKHSGPSLLLVLLPVLLGGGFAFWWFRLRKKKPARPILPEDPEEEPREDEND